MKTRKNVLSVFVAVFVTIILVGCSRDFTPLAPTSPETLSQLLPTASHNDEAEALQFTTSLYGEPCKARIIVSLKDKGGNIVFQGEVIGSLPWTFGHCQLSLEAHGLSGFPCQYTVDNPWHSEDTVSPGDVIYLQWASINP